MKTDGGGGVGGGPSPQKDGLVSGFSSPAASNSNNLIHFIEHEYVIKVPGGRLADSGIGWMAHKCEIKFHLSPSMDCSDHRHVCISKDV